VTEQKLN